MTEPLATGAPRRLLVGCLALSLAGPPLGVFLVLRRMSLMSDALQHGILPGVAAGFLVGGLSVPAMGLGGFVAGLAVALLAGWLARATGGHEDAQFAGVYLVALALGVVMVAAQPELDLEHLLFGSASGVDTPALLLMAGSASLVLAGLAVVWRPIAIESFDPLFVAGTGGRGGAWHMLFLALVVLCVVAGFTALGTLMSVGLMMLPAIAARHWSGTLAGQAGAAVALAVLASLTGVLAAWHAGLPPGAMVVLAAGTLWLVSTLAGPRASLLARMRRPPLAAP